MRRWGLLLSISAALVGFLALTNPTPGQLYNSLLPRIQQTARQNATAPAAEHRALESAGTFFGPGGAAIAGGIVGELQTAKEADFLVAARGYFDAHLVTINGGVGSLFIICFQRSDGTAIRRTWLGIAGQFIKLRETACS